MTMGSVVGVLSILIVASAPNLPVFIAGWLLAGLAMAGTFYQPAFAALTRWWAPDHVRALTIVTLAGGLASTVFAPLTAALADHLSWRAAYAAPRTRPGRRDHSRPRFRAQGALARAADLHRTPTSGGTGQVARTRPF